MTQSPMVNYECLPKWQRMQEFIVILILCGDCRRILITQVKLFMFVYTEEMLN